MIRVPLYNIQVFLVITCYVAFFIMVTDGLFRFDYTSVPYSRYPTFSEVLATNSFSALMYGILATLYAVSKGMMASFYIIVGRPYGWTIVVLSYLHIVGFVSVGVANITLMKDTHYAVATLTFGSAFIKSVVLHLSRANTTRMDYTEISMNRYYLVLLFIMECLFAYRMQGFVEWILIIFILTENVFQAFDFRSHTLDMSVDDKQQSNTMSDAEFSKFRKYRLTRFNNT